MECEGIYELIQRDLDSDLDDSEKTELMLHLSNCPDCMELAERLHTISTRLEQLPMVKPPFSIVDSILPQLDMIDQERKLSVAPSLAADEQVAAIDRKQIDIKKRRLFWYRSAGGFIAAGLLLSVVLFNMGEGTAPKESALSMPEKYKGTEPDKTEVAKTSSPVSPDPAAGKNRDNVQEKLLPAENTKQVAVIGSANKFVASSESPSDSHAGEANSAPDDVQQPDKGQPAEKMQNQTQDTTQSHPSEAGTGVKTPLRTKQGDNVGGAVPDNAAKLPENNAVAVAPKENADEAKMGNAPAPNDPNPGTAHGIMGFAGNDSNTSPNAGDAREKNSAASGTYKPPGDPSPGEDYFIDDSGNQLLVRDKTGQISFATHTWNAAYNVSYRWINDRTIEYTLQYSQENQSRTPSDLHVQKWIVDLEKNLERPVYK